MSIFYLSFSIYSSQFIVVLDPLGNGLKKWIESLGKLYKRRLLSACLILKAIQARVYGRVQKVGYRRFILDTAQELGLSGYVKNERDGSVTIFTQGDEAVLERFIETMKSPPQPAYVKSINIKEVKPRPAIKYFTIKPSPSHEEL
jgi:acylphosphatase